MSYFTELSRAMELIGAHPRAVFMGQAVACPGTAMTRTLAGVPKDKLLEMPVAEDMQMGMAIGAALNGDLPVAYTRGSIFLLLAASQLVLHLDKLPLYSRGGFTRRRVDSTRRLHRGLPVADTVTVVRRQAERIVESWPRQHLTGTSRRTTIERPEIQASSVRGEKMLMRNRSKMTDSGLGL